jgi:hypothetical protein
MELVAWVRRMWRAIRNPPCPACGERDRHAIDCDDRWIELQGW